MEHDRTIDFRYAPASRWTAICRPDDPNKTLVREDGALLYGFDRLGLVWRFARVIEFGIQTDQRPLTITQHTESARVPVVVTTMCYPKATLELRAFAHVHDGDRRSDVVRWTIRAADDATAFLTGLRIDAYEQNRVFVGRSSASARAIFAVDPAHIPPHSAWDDVVRHEDEAVPPPGALAFISVPHGLRLTHATGFRPMFGLMIEPAILHGGDELGGALVVPLNHDVTAGMDLAWADAALATERAFWAGYAIQPLPMVVPDPAVMDMITACARNILQAREIKDGLPVFQVGATCYRGLWVVDGHFILECAQYLGLADDAMAALDTLLLRVRPNGAIAQFEHHIKETAVALATLVRQCELLGDDTRLRAVWPIVQRAVGYLEDLRTQAYALPAEHPAYRLLPVAFADGGLAGERPEYTTTFWVLSGLRTVTAAAQALGYSEDAVRFQADFDSLLADFRTSAARTSGTLPDGTPYLPVCLPGSGDHHMIPDYPITPPPWRHIRPESATWAYAQAIWPGEVFQPDDPLVRNLLTLLDQCDDQQGIPSGTGWMPYQALWAYSASFYAHAWLYVGVPDKAIDYLYAFANHATPTRVWREEQSVSATHDGQLYGEMPHNWASAEFIRLVRHLLVFERGDVLELLPGLPATWCKPGDAIHLERTPTRYGPVSLTVRVAADGGSTTTVALAGQWPSRPARVRLHVGRLGAGRCLVDRQAVELSADGTIDLPLPGSAAVTIDVAIM